MAITTITAMKLTDRDTFATAVATTGLFKALNATDGAEFAPSARDDKVLLLVQNGGSSAETLTVKAGNGIQGVDNLTVSIAASSTTAVVLSSGRFKQMSGANKGKVLFTGSADLKIAAFELP